MNYKSYIKYITYLISITIYTLIINIYNSYSESLYDQIKKARDSSDSFHGYKPYSPPSYKLDETISALSNETILKYNFNKKDNFIFELKNVKFKIAKEILSLHSNKCIQSIPSSNGSYHIVCNDGSFVCIEIDKISIDYKSHEYIVDDNLEVNLFYNTNRIYKDRIIK